jgi:hypothetical protein
MRCLPERDLKSLPMLRSNGASWSACLTAIPPERTLVWRVPNTKEPKGVGIFGRVIGGPTEQNLADFYADGGITFSGLSRIAYIAQSAFIGAELGVTATVTPEPKDNMNNEPQSSVV